MKPAPQVLYQEVEGELVILDSDAGRYYALDDVGLRVWELLVEHADLDRVVAVMLSEFDVDEATLRSDVDALVKQLEAAGLVVARDDPV